jgi:hypothetical protein
MKRTIKIKVCINCLKEFTYTSESEHKNRIRKFCSIKCCGKFKTKNKNTNKKNTKPRQRNTCACGNRINGYLSKKCQKCHIQEMKDIFLKKMKTITVEECLKTSKNYKPCNTYQSIRNNAKAVMKWNNIEKKCNICGYNKHVEVCHIMAITTFSINTTLDIVNSNSNLIYLCPNHHWELDNGILKL